jgi:monovalent cation:H+ antiporter, CPA1 family
MLTGIIATTTTSTSVANTISSIVAINNFLTSQYVIPVFLVMVFVAAIFSSKAKIPYTMILVVFGIIISFLSFAGLDIANPNHFRIDPNLVINFIIPPLIFEAMMNVDYKHFKEVRVSALLLATIGVILATLVGGVILMYIARLPLLVSFAFAALIAPTDAAIVIEIFKRVKVPKVLSTLMEFEASFNDATGAIVFSSIVALAFVTPGLTSASNSTSSSPSLNNGVVTNTSTPNHAINLDIAKETVRFGEQFFGGMAIGLAIAAATHRLHILTNDPLSETSLTIATVFGSVVLANSLGVSGLVAVAAAGLYFGNVTVKKEAIMSKSVRTFVFNFWEMIAFLASSAAFLYLGLSMDLIAVSQHIFIIVLAFIAILAARAVIVYPILAATSSKLIKENIPNSWRHVVMIGGMRGAISIALVASLPQSDFKNTLQTITFGVVLFSLIIQYVVLSRYTKKVFPEVKL